MLKFGFLISLLRIKVLMIGFCPTLLSLLRSKSYQATIGLALLALLTACSTFNTARPFETLQNSKGSIILVSLHAPHHEYHCEDLGFLPCSLGEGKPLSPSGKEHQYCAKNILTYAENVGTNYIHIEAPLEALGITWRDSKANLYNCQFLPQPSQAPLSKSSHSPLRSTNRIL